MKSIVRSVTNVVEYASVGERCRVDLPPVRGTPRDVRRGVEPAAQQIVVDTLGPGPLVVVGAGHRSVTERQLDVPEPVEVVGVDDPTVLVTLLVFERVPSFLEGREHPGRLAEIGDRGTALAVLKV